MSADPEIDVILMNIPSRIFSGAREGLPAALVKVLGDFAEKRADAKPIVVALSEGTCLGMTENGVRSLRRGGIVAFASLSRACRALRRFAGYHEAMAERRQWEVDRG